MDSKIVDELARFIGELINEEPLRIISEARKKVEKEQGYYKLLQAIKEF